MEIVTQFSIFMVNKPGVLAQVLGEFARARINIVAVTMMDSVEHGVLRVIFEDTAKARNVLAKLSMPFSETQVLAVTLTNQSGALADLAEKLAQNHINISYAYCTSGAKGGRTTGVFKVADVKKAMKVLTREQKRTSKKTKVVKRDKTGK
jgi:hypothetical protein